MDITKEIKNLIMIDNEKYLKEVEDYDYWGNHIKFVVEESVNLAKMYGADVEIVEISALLHDIAKLKRVGPSKEHAMNGSIIAEEILNGYDYPLEKIEKIKGCILHHSKSSYAENVEELCVADADILAHFDNYKHIYKSMLKIGYDVAGAKTWFEKDFNDLSERTQQIFKPRYEEIMNELFS